MPGRDEAGIAGLVDDVDALNDARKREDEPFNVEFASKFGLPLNFVLVTDVLCVVYPVAMTSAVFLHVRACTSHSGYLAWAPVDAHFALSKFPISSAGIMEFSRKETRLFFRHKLQDGYLSNKK